MSIGDLVSILVVEDEETVFDLILETFVTNKPVGWPLKYKIQNTKTLAEANRLLSTGKYNIVILDLNLPDSQGVKTFYNLRTNIPIIVLAGESDGIFEQLLRDGAKRCYSKTFVSSCIIILHHSVRHVLAAERLQKTVDQQNQTIMGHLRPTIVECAGCRRWRDERTGNWTSILNYLKQRNFIISHSHCPDCEHDFYGTALAEVVSDYK